MHSTRRAGASIVALALATFFGRSLAAQIILGPGESAVPVPRGVIRTTMFVDIAHYDERFRTDGKAEPLGTDFNLASLDPRTLPSLLAPQERLRTITGRTDLTLTLGRIGVTEDARITTIPLQAELGLTRRISILAMMPIVRTRTTVSLATGDDATGANASYNPQLVTATTAAATAANRLVQTQVAGARDALDLLLERCRDDPATDARCGKVLSESAAVEALTASATTVALALAETYGGGTAPPAEFVPLAGSELQAEVDARLAELSSSFAAYLGGPTPITARPFAALGPLTASQAQTAFANEFFGAHSIRSIDRIGIGDVEFGARFLLFDGVSGATPSGDRRFGVRLAVSPVFRVGTAPPDAPINWFDIPLGDAQNDIEVRGYADVVVGRHFSASFIGRYAMQLPDEELMRIPDAPGDVYLPRFREQLVRRDLGDFFEVEARPRYVFRDYLAISGLYLYRHKSEDRHTGQFVVPAVETGGLGEITLDASTLDAKTEAIEHRAGLGITFSSVPAFQRRRSRLPLEVSFMHVQSVRGLGGRTPKLQSDQVHLRFYTRIFGAPESAK
jgi:hypothetical protein